MSDRIDALERLAALHQSGALSDVEFADEKARLENKKSVAGWLLAAGALFGITALALVNYGGSPQQDSVKPVDEASTEPRPSKTSEKPKKQQLKPKPKPKPRYEKVRVSAWFGEVDPSSIRNLERAEGLRNCRKTAQLEQITEDKSVVEVTCEKIR